MARLVRIASWLAMAASAVPPFAIAFLVARHARNVPARQMCPVMAAARIGPFAP